MSNRWFPEPCRRRAAVFACLAALLTGQGPIARAQISLPGAVAPEAEGAVAEGVKHPASKSAHKRARAGDAEEQAAAGPAIAPKAPSDDAIVGKPLYQDGERSIVEFQRVGGETRLSRLTLTGDRMSRSGDSCRVDVSETPLKLTPREGDAGLRRYRVDFPACPFSFDVLDGAILVSNEGGACEIKAADCRVDPTGLWGEKDFDEKRGKQMLGTRARVEKTVRADFRELYVKNKKDKPLRKLLVREQAGFSSRREEICRNYAARGGLRLLRAARDRGARADARHATRGGNSSARADMPAEEAPRKKGRKK